MRIWSIHPGYLDSKGLVALVPDDLTAQEHLKAGRPIYCWAKGLQPDEVIKKYPDGQEVVIAIASLPPVKRTDRASGSDSFLESFESCLMRAVKRRKAGRKKTVDK
jgi:hypothetical protein